MTEKIQVLHLEDNALDAELVREQLEADGLPCEIVHVDGKARFEAALTQRAFDLILVDYKLPGYDGLSALALAADRQPGVPLIILSGALGDETATECLKRCATDYVLKGYIGRLVPVVRRALAEAEERRRRQAAEQKLRDSEAWFRSLIENASDLITVINAGGIISFQSPSLQRVLGYPPENLLGRNIFELVHPDDASHARSVFQGIFSGPPRTVTLECRFRHCDGSWRVLQSSSRALPARPGEALAVINLRDVTKAKQLEAELFHAQKREIIAQLAGGIAHAFNNVLAVIVGHREVLELTLPPEEPSRQSVAEIGRAAERAAALTRQLLSLSCQQVLGPQRLDLNAVVASAQAMLRPLIGENVRLTTRLQPDLSPVRADPGQFEQALLNLTIHTRDAMPQGGALRFETRNVDLQPAQTDADPDVPPGRYVLLAVTGTGLSLTAEEQARVFEPFSTMRGAGLGLAAVRGFVEQSGGHVEVYSLPGLGTTFALFFPAVPGPVASAPERWVSELPQGRGERVLLVEDEAPVRAVTARLLESLGYQALEAASAEEALHLLGDGRLKVELLMTDVILPGRNGQQLAEALRRRDATLKVLFQSGYTGDAVTRFGIVGSEMAFLGKPFTREALAKKVREALEM